MPTIYRQRGFEVRIYVDDHEPAHVHVFLAGSEVKIHLGLQAGDPARVVKRRGMADRDVVVAVRIVEKNRERFLAAWRSIHG